MQAFPNTKFLATAIRNNLLIAYNKYELQIKEMHFIQIVHAAIMFIIITITCFNVNY